MQEQEQNKSTPIRAWGTGGPLTPAQRKEAKAFFLEELQRVHCVAFACEYAGIGRTAVYAWKEKDKAFAEAWSDAVERSRDIARQSIYQRAFLGWQEPAISLKQVVYNYTPILDERGNQKFDSQGRPLMNRADVVLITKYSDQLAVAWAKANLPEYKEQQIIDLNIQIKEQAEKAKDDLLAGLAAAIANEDKEQAS